VRLRSGPELPRNRASSRASGAFTGRRASVTRYRASRAIRAPIWRAMPPPRKWTSWAGAPFSQAWHGDYGTTGGGTSLSQMLGVAGPGSRTEPAMQLCAKPVEDGSPNQDPATDVESRR